MERLTTIIPFLLLLGLLAIPIILFIAIKKWCRLKFDVITYLVSGLILTAGIMWAFAWYSDYSDQLLMSHYGYDFNAMNDIERFADVESKNLEKVKKLEIGYYGIGWPLKAIISFIFYSPYLLIVYGVGQLTRRMKTKHS